MMTRPKLATLPGVAVADVRQAFVDSFRSISAAPTIQIDRHPGRLPSQIGHSRTRLRDHPLVPRQCGAVPTWHQELARDRASRHRLLPPTPRQARRAVRNSESQRAAQRRRAAAIYCLRLPPQLARGLARLGLRLPLAQRAPTGSPTQLGPRRRDADRDDEDSDLSEFFLAGATAGTHPISGLAMPSARLAGGRRAKGWPPAAGPVKLAGGRITKCHVPAFNSG